ncbi:MAG TPA: GlsB/YeaQ/YmgE family stress response membrane protein [Thermodesulfobacteriota bacterium]|nr:GlsB/YeaQ/YmgE family stress response membrane protein [Thermodesulfobacteriota bacterium]
MGILSWIILGLIAGAIAKLILPGKDPGGIIVTIVIGIVGAIIGGYIATLLGLGSVTGFNIGSLIIAVIGSIVLLLIYRMVKKPT